MRITKKWLQVARQNLIEHVRAIMKMTPEERVAEAQRRLTGFEVVGKDDMEIARSCITMAIYEEFPDRIVHG